MSNQLNEHILEKIMDNQKLLQDNLDIEDYMKCAYHRDEIARLIAMLEPEETEA